MASASFLLLLLLFYSYPSHLIFHFLSFPVLGKAEGTPNDFHGHVTALTVAPEYRRLSLARILMNFLETASDDVYGGMFVDLYVRCTNSIAIDLYEGLGYSVYRRVREYYGSFGGGKDEEDAFGPSLLLFPREKKRKRRILMVTPLVP